MNLNKVAPKPKNVQVGSSQKHPSKRAPPTFEQWADKRQATPKRQFPPPWKTFCKTSFIQNRNWTRAH